jgi:RNA polymerase sigma-70 factor (TIGR02960 family)
MSQACDRARAGDPDAFAILIKPYRRELHVHCYRMLGSVVDADDVLQETLTAAWRGLDGFAGHSSMRTWLYSIATNRCLNAIRNAKRRPPPAPVPPFQPPDPSRHGDLTWLQPYPDTWLDQLPDRTAGPADRHQASEAVELAFIAVLQRLPPRQTAVVVLCDVLDFSSAEVAGMLSVTPTAIKGLLQRGRATLDQEHPPARRRPTPPDSPTDRDLARRFALAFATDDIDGVITLLTDDAWLAMPPAPHEYHGPVAIATFLHASATSRSGRHFELLPTRANHQPAFACSLAGNPTGVLVLTPYRDQISTIMHFLDPRLPSRFKLPAPPRCM